MTLAPQHEAKSFSFCLPPLRLSGLTLLRPGAVVEDRWTTARRVRELLKGR